MAVVIAVVAFQAMLAQFGLGDADLEGMQEFAEFRASQSLKGGSNIGGTGLTGAGIPMAVINVWFRPFLWEAHNPMAAVAAMEMVLFWYLVWRNRRGLKPVLKNWRRSRLIAFAIPFLVLFTFMIGLVMGNMGLLARQRTPIFPFAFMVIAAGTAAVPVRRRVARHWAARSPAGVAPPGGAGNDRAPSEEWCARSSRWSRSRRLEEWCSATTWWMPVPHPRWTFRTSLFRDHMETLAEVAHVVTLDGLVAGLSGGGSAAKTRVVITFDDAFKNFFTTAWPVMRGLGLPVTLYVPVGFVNGESPSPMTGGEDLEAATWEELREGVASGLLTIGSHSWTHPDIRALDRSSAERELGDSRRVLEDRLGTPVTSFCYPRGMWDQRRKGWSRSTTTPRLSAGGSG